MCVCTYHDVHMQGRQSVYLFTLPPPSPPHSDTPMDYKVKSALVCDTLSLAGVPLQDPFTAVRAASAGYTRGAAKRSGPSVQLVSEQLQSTAAVGLLLHMLCLCMYAGVGGSAYVKHMLCVHTHSS